MAFCNFCDCHDCEFGRKDLSHAQTIDGKWICDVCYTYDLCTADGPNRNLSGPCEDKNCQHRPKLITEWSKLDTHESCTDCGSIVPVNHDQCIICESVDNFNQS